MQTENANIAASPATVYRKRNRCRVKALENSEAILTATNALQLSYDAKRIDGIDRYVFLGQFLDVNGDRCEKVLGVKSFYEKSVTTKVVFEAIVDEACISYLSKVYSVISDTTSLNSGEKNGVNRRFPDYFIEDLWGMIFTHWNACSTLMKFISAV